MLSNILALYRHWTSTYVYKLHIRIDCLGAYVQNNRHAGQQIVYFHWGRILKVHKLTCIVFCAFNVTCMVLCCFVPAKVYQSALLICTGLVCQHRLHQCPALSAAMYGLTVSEILQGPLLELVQNNASTAHGCSDSEAHLEKYGMYCSELK